MNDLLPGDYYPLVSGSSTLATYVYDRQAEGPYAQGKLPLKGKLDNQIYALRLGHFFEVGGKPLSLIAVIPWADASVSPRPLAAALGNSASGMGDLRFGATQWLLTDTANGEYLAISAVASLPTGNYDATKILNIGENRSKYTVNLGWYKTLSSAFVLEVSPEIAWYGANNDYLNGKRLEQAQSTAFTTMLRYRASPQWHFHVSHQANAGGATTLNGTVRDDALRNERLMLGTTLTSADKQHQFIVRVARDTHIDNGFKTSNELLFRYLRMY